MQAGGYRAPLPHRQLDPGEGRAGDGFEAIGFRSNRSCAQARARRCGRGGNTDSHVKTILTDTSVRVPLQRNGRLELGTWQGIYLCEFDGPRSRNVKVVVLEEAQAGRADSRLTDQAGRRTAIAPVPAGVGCRHAPGG